LIDSIAVDIPFEHTSPIFGGMTYSVDQDGVMKWQKERYRRLEGSFDQATMVKTIFLTEAERNGWKWGEYHNLLGQRFHTLRVEGSAAKFLQGHNLFGSDNLPGLIPVWCRAVLEALGFIVPRDTFQAWVDGKYRLHRVDVARMGLVGSDRDVSDVLSALTHQGTFIGRGRGISWGHTVMWGRRSSRQAVVKAYDKFHEIHLPSHELPEGISHLEGLKQYARGCVRFEVEFHAKALDKLGLREGAAWHADTSERIFEDAMSKLNISGQQTLTPDLIQRLPHHLRGTYAIWANGQDVRSAFRTKQNFYKHRRQLLPLGVDIALPHSAAHRPKVVSLALVIQPVPRPVPSWAYGTSLLAAA
jgi:II/X family phage/plasmid replication protein